MHHEMFAGGIDYLTLLFDIRDIAPEELPYLAILKAVLGYVDTKSYSYAELANEINIHTGGISSGIGIYPSVRDNSELELKYEIYTKVVAEKLPDAMAMIKEIISSSKISDEKRLYEILAQAKSRLQVGLSASGHSVASIRAMSYFSRSAYYQDATGGIGAYRMIADYEEHFEEKKDELVAHLERLAARIFTAERMMVSVTCEQKDFPEVVREVAEVKGVPASVHRLSDRRPVAAA